MAEEQSLPFTKLYHLDKIYSMKKIVTIFYSHTPHEVWLYENIAKK